LILQLNPSIPVITPKGKGEAIGWIDYSAEYHLLWIVFLDESGESWIFKNGEIRACENPTLGRHKISEIKSDPFNVDEIGC